MSSDLSGKSIGRYHILERLGQGGMAVVYKAYDTRLERDVAIKVIRREAFPQEHLERILRRFEHEAKTMARLSHPNIVRIHDFGEYEGAPYLVMEYLPGQTLKAVLGKRKRLHWREAVELLLPIARALQHAHQHRLVHRDVKPSNILLSEEGEPFLSDFGIAKILETGMTFTLTGTGVGVGTPEYMSPEQGLGKEVDARSDIYSLGVVLYEMVTGRKPYTADTPMAVILSHVSDPLPRPTLYAPDLPYDVEKFLIKALAKDPKARFQSMQEVISALQALLESKTASLSTIPFPDDTEQTAETVDYSTRPEMKPSGKRWKPIKWFGLAAALLCLLCAGGGIAYLATRENGHPAQPAQESARPAAISTTIASPTPRPPQPSFTLPVVPPTYTPLPTYTPYPTSTTRPTSTPEPYFDLAFASNRDGEFAVYLMGTDLGEWVKLGRPSGYERVWWPTFCGSRLAAEVYDVDRKNPQWIYYLDLQGRSSALNPTSSVNAERLGVPRCSPDAQYIAYSAYIGDVWTMFVAETFSNTAYEFSPADSSVTGYASWASFRNRFLFQVVTREDNRHLIYALDGQSYQQGAYPVTGGGNPSISPDGNQMVYSCEARGYDYVLCLDSVSNPRGVSFVTIYSQPVYGLGIQPVSDWSADGNWIYYASAEDGDWDIYRVHPDGTGRTNLTSDWNSDEIMPAARR